MEDNLHHLDCHELQGNLLWHLEHIPQLPVH